MTDAFKDFYNRQYAEVEGDETRAVDHSFYRYLLPFAKTRNDIAAKILAGSRFEKALELGCGTGKLAALKIADFGHYTGLDISSYQLSKISGILKNNPRAVFRESDLNKPFNFPEASFDLVLALSVIQYIFDPQSFLKEIHRALKPGGTFIIQAENIAFLPRRLQLLCGKLPTVNNALGWEGGILHRFTYAAMKGLLESQGFEVLEQACSGLAPSLRMWLPGLLAGDIIFKCRK